MPAPARLLRLLERWPWATLDGARNDQLSLQLPPPRSQAWTVTGSFKGRMPAAFESDLWVCLHSLWNEAGRPEDCMVRLRTVDLLDRMRKPRGGTTYKQLADAIARLRAVQIVGDAVEFNGKRSRSVCGMIDAGRVEEDGWTWVRLSREICDALTTEGRLLDYARYVSFTRPTTRRLYRYLDHRRYRGREAMPVVEIPLSELAAELPIQRERATDQKKTLAPAHAELIEGRWLTNADYIRRGRSWFVRYTFPQGRHGEVAAPARSEGEWATMLAREFHDAGSVAFYMDAVRKLPESIVESIVGDIRDGIRAGKLAPRHAGRTFTNKAKHAAKQAGISLGGAR